MAKGKSQVKESYEFYSKYSELQITYKEEQTRVIGDRMQKISGENIQFNAGRFATTDYDKAEFLRNLPYFGTEIFEGGFPQTLKSAPTYKPLAPLAEMNRGQLEDYAKFLDIEVEAGDTNDEIRKGITQQLLINAGVDITGKENSKPVNDGQDS